MSKYSVGVYGTFPRPWQAPRSAPVQARLDERPSVDTVAGAHGPATIETFTIIDPTRRPRAAVVARSASGARFYARVDPEDSDTMALLCDGEPIGQSVRVTSTDGLNTVRINGDRPPAP